MTSQPTLLKATVCKLRYSRAFYPNATIYFKVSNITDFHLLIEKVKRNHVNENEELTKVYWKDNEQSSVVIDPYDSKDFEALYEYSTRKGCQTIDIYFNIRKKEVKPGNHAYLEGKDKLFIYQNK